MTLAAWIRCCPWYRCPQACRVATVAINGAKNAAILAVQIMGTGCNGARQKIIDMKKAMAEA